jgi:hypothetical protein
MREGIQNSASFRLITPPGHKQINYHSLDDVNKKLLITIPHHFHLNFYFLSTRDKRLPASIFLKIVFYVGETGAMWDMGL